jgi:tetratricopeptide (TPR) repeat protein
MGKKISIVRELDVNGRFFNLKSETSGKFSVHDSYRDNYNNGFLVKIDAPADVNNALNDIYYATDKGVIISYKEFNNRIVAVRNQLLVQNFPGRELKDLPKEERLKTERESAKNVLKELSISESTKLIFSPELSTLKKEYENEYQLKFIPEESKIIFYILEGGESGQPGAAKKAPLRKDTRSYLEFNEKVKQLVSRAMDSHNLDELELTRLELDKYFENFAGAKENQDFQALYLKNNKILTDEVEIIRQEQQKLEESLNDKVNELLSKKEYKRIKNTVQEIRREFSENNHIKNDTKSKTIRDLAIEKLSNAGKVISLVVLKDWNTKNLEVADFLLQQNLPQELETLLRKKFEQEEIKVKTEQEKLQGIDFKDSKLIYNRFKDLVRYKPVFANLFDMLTETGFAGVNTIIKDLGEDFANFLFLLANNLPFEKFRLLWENLTPEINQKILSEEFPYLGFKKDKLICLFLQSVISQENPEIITAIFSKIKTRTIQIIDPALLFDIIRKLDSVGYDTELFMNRVYPSQLLELLKLEQVKQDFNLQALFSQTLIKWFPTLDSGRPEFSEILVRFPMQTIEKLRKKQIEAMTPEFVLKILEALDINKEALQYFVYRVGKEKYEAAIRIKLLAMVNENPNSYEIHYNLGITSLNARDFSAAVSAFKRALGINPELPEGHYNLGFALENLGQYDLALSEYKKAISKKYGYLEAYYNLGLLYNKMNDKQLAMQQFKKILKIDPDNYDASISLGITYDDLGETDNAIREYERAMAINPEKTTAYINLANCYCQKGNFDAAIDLYSRAVGFEPENALVQYNLGILFQKQQNYTMAKAHYKLAIRFNPAYSEAYNNLGLVYFFQVNLPDSITMFSKSIELDNNIDAYNNLGWSYYVVGDLDKAVEVYEKAKKINPKHAILSLNLGTVYFKKGEIPKAIKELENYLVLEPESSNSEEVANILKSLKVTK